MDLDEAFSAVGEFGRYQFFYFMFSNLVGFPLTFQMLHMVFIGAKPEFLCADNQPIDFIMRAPDIDNYTSSTTAASVQASVQSTLKSELTNCQQENGETCSRYIYTSNFTSIITEWDLVCDYAYEASFGQSILMAGVLVGAAVFGPLTDAYGRKKMFFITLFCAMVTGLASAFSPNVKIFLFFRFLSGFNCAGTILSSFVLLMEIVGTEWRPAVSMLGSIFGSMGIATMALLAYYIPNWRRLSTVYAFSGFFFIPFYTMIPESPRWLYGKGRVKEAEMLLLRFARRNGRTHIKEIHLNSPERVDEQVGSLKSLVKTWPLLKVTIIQLYSWFVNCVVYYGLTMSAGELGGSMYVDVILSGLVEIPSALLLLFLLKFIGRRLCCCGFMVMGGVACMCTMVVPTTNTVAVVALAMLGKLSISASFGVIYLWSAEIFPTVIRNSSMGLMSMGARVGGILAPAINLVGLTSAPLPYLIYGAFAFSAGLLNYFLPETRLRVLPQTLDDMDKLIRGAVDVGSKNVAGSDDQRVQLLRDNGDAADDDDECVHFERSNVNCVETETIM